MNELKDFLVIYSSLSDFFKIIESYDINLWTSDKKLLIDFIQNKNPKNWYLIPSLTFLKTLWFVSEKVDRILESEKKREVGLVYEWERKNKK
ncbi:MAG: hypothetical protein ACD_4C00133G0007 [uncultured bacterium (gcode 4)]|uniref:Uncharacterized protein n=1 Tax=uncultured bacterium (gcode 4) TaxID=1234023 RepID=K2G9N6_9BACT|nr:MAG: hypothetical protein ACD_4C00133G0007 [uncultured bacterium (gcode 4)]